MPTLRDLTHDEETLVLETSKPGEPLVITYRPGAITPRQVQRMRDFEARGFANLSPAEQEQATDETPRMLAATLVDWNLDAPDGTRIPPTVEGLQDVDYGTQAYLLRALLDAQRLGESSAQTPSGASSTPTSPAGKLQPPASPRPLRPGTPTKRSASGSA